MHTNYGDILKLTDQKPIWFDEYAVPRFCEFSTNSLANIYAREAALAIIECQRCGEEFKVAFSEVNLKHDLWKDSKRVKNICDLIVDGSIHYGDPPNIGCCNAGASMNSIPIRILEYWFKPIIHGRGVENGTVKDINMTYFQRDPKFEIEI